MAVEKICQSREEEAMLRMKSLSGRDERVTNVPVMPKICQVRGQSYKNCV